MHSFILNPDFIFTCCVCVCVPAYTENLPQDRFSDTI